MEIDYSPYTYESIVDDGTIYIFKTDFELLYEISFKPTPYLFPSEKPFAKDAYEFSIIVIENPKHASPPFDNRIGGTIAKIFDSFYEQYGNTISLYICASHDNRQMVRFKKFGGWFTTFGNPKYIKIEAIPVDSKGIRFPLALIMKYGNPYKNEIVEAFHDLLLSFQK
ncbi:MAG: DUF6169 family protein [Arcicella sp.]|nr:DUF6169 family protein [Arcicella sp.]